MKVFIQSNTRGHAPFGEQDPTTVASPRDNHSAQKRRLCGPINKCQEPASFQKRENIHRIMHSKRRRNDPKLPDGTKGGSVDVFNTLSKFVELEDFA